MKKLYSLDLKIDGMDVEKFVRRINKMERKSTL